MLPQMLSTFHVTSGRYLLFPMGKEKMSESEHELRDEAQLVAIYARFDFDHNLQSTHLQYNSNAILVIGGQPAGPRQVHQHFTTLQTDIHFVQELCMV